MYVYVYTLTSKKKIVTWTLTGLLRGVLNRPVKIFCTYFGHIYIFYVVLFRFYHVRCLNILKFGHIFHFRRRKNVGAFWLTCYFRAVFWPYLTGHFISCVIARRSARAWLKMFEWGLQRIYGINTILYKKFLVKPNWVKIRQILGVQYRPPPLDLTLIWKLGPDRVNGFVIKKGLFCCFPY